MSRRQSNGRSPLVNPQRQITSFFSKTMSSPSPSPSPSLSKKSPKAATSPVPKNPKYSPKSSPGSSPTTPSPFQSKLKKPVLVIGTSPPTPAEKRYYGDDVVGRRIKVYWPLDKAWYEGSVKSFNKEANKHLIQYDDAQEELLDLEKEKIQWVEAGGKKKLKRLRRSSLNSEDAEEIKVDKEEGPEEFKRSRRRGAKVIVEEEVESDDADGGDGHDDSSDEDWGKNVEEEVVEDGEEDVELEEEDDEDGKVKGSKQKHSSSSKRKVSEGEKLGYAKKSKNSGGGEPVAARGFKLSLMEPASNAESK